LKIPEHYTLGEDDQKELFARAVPLRRELHQIAELGFREFKTAALVAETLEQLGIVVKSGIGGTGVIAFYLERIPGCFAFVGAAPQNDPAFPHHHPRFDICEDSLKVAASLLARIGFDAGWEYG